MTSTVVHLINTVQSIACFYSKVSSPEYSNQAIWIGCSSNGFQPSVSLAFYSHR
jgi:hypothetical protein